jgi:hypothetical protein
MARRTKSIVKPVLDNWVSTARRVLQKYQTWAGPTADSPTRKRQSILMRRNEGSDDGVLANELSIITPSTPIAQRLEQLSLSDMATALRRTKARDGGCREKKLTSIDVLARFTQKATPGCHKERELCYRSFRWMLVATGCRPAELHTSSWTLLKKELHLIIRARKDSQAQGKRARIFKFAWSTPPPRDVREYLSRQQTCPIGNEGNVACCINSWLRSRGADSSITSTSPRVRLDNVLGPMVEDREINLEIFEWLMGHTWSTSMRSYRRI